jgi:hypothetical protein
MSVFAYSIVKYVPSAGRDEQMNVGLVLAARSPQFFRARFLHKSQTARLKSLGGSEDFSFLDGLALELKQSAAGSSQLSLPRLFVKHWDLGVLETAVRDWKNTIQFSPLRAIEGEDPDQLLDDLYQRYVASPRPAKRRGFRDKRWIKAKVGKTLREAARRLHPDRDVSSLIHRSQRAVGEFEEHRFDYGISNGKLLQLVQTFSFETPESTQLRTELDATAWAVEDLHRSNADIPVSVVTVGETQAKLLEESVRMYRGIGAEVVRENDFDNFAQSMSSVIARA